MNNQMNEFLKSEEYLAWQKSFWELCFSDRSIDEEFENQLLFAVLI